MVLAQHTQRIRKPAMGPSQPSRAVRQSGVRKEVSDRSSLPAQSANGGSEDHLNRKLSLVCFEPTEPSPIFDVLCHQTACV